MVIVCLSIAWSAPILGLAFSQNPQSMKPVLHPQNLPILKGATTHRRPTRFSFQSDREKLQEPKSISHRLRRNNSEMTRRDRAVTQKCQFCPTPDDCFGPPGRWRSIRVGRTSFRDHGARKSNTLVARFYVPTVIFIIQGTSISDCRPPKRFFGMGWLSLSSVSSPQQPTILAHQQFPEMRLRATALLHDTASVR
jgi:hypothetical protein